MSLKSKVLRNISNWPGKSFKRKIVVFESDDWGSIRMSDSNAFKILKSAGIVKPFSEEYRYLENDTLATALDLEMLFHVLESHKDINGKSSVFTALTIMANPDFDEIEKNDFKSYFYTPFTSTLNNSHAYSNSWNLWKQGIQSNLFYPQFHGREHLNVHAWLKGLQCGNEDLLLSFQNRVYGIKPRMSDSKINLQAAFDINDPSELNYLSNVIKDGLRLFEETFEYKAEFFVPTNGPFNNMLEASLYESGIKFIGASKIQNQPIGYGKTNKSFHYLGQKNRFGQTYLTRNCFFEPSSRLKANWVDSCLSDIETAFRWNKPAVISTHRVNYIGALNESNRNKGLNSLNLLLKGMLRRWPDIEFMNSVQLGKLCN